jgi:hypothetical protein
MVGKTNLGASVVRQRIGSALPAKTGDRQQYNRPSDHQ